MALTRETYYSKVVVFCKPDAQLDPQSNWNETNVFNSPQLLVQKSNYCHPHFISHLDIVAIYLVIVISDFLASLQLSHFSSHLTTHQDQISPLKFRIHLQRIPFKSFLKKNLSVRLPKLCRTKRKRIKKEKPNHVDKPSLKSQKLKTQQLLRV